MSCPLWACLSLLVTTLSSMISCLVLTSGLAMSTSTSGLLIWLTSPSPVTSGRYLSVQTRRSAYKNTDVQAQKRRSYQSSTKQLYTTWPQIGKLLNKMNHNTNMCTRSSFPNTTPAAVMYTRGSNTKATSSWVPGGPKSDCHNTHLVNTHTICPWWQTRPEQFIKQ